jgi:polysaccharide export outer membrane protein
MTNHYKYLYFFLIFYCFVKGNCTDTDSDLDIEPSSSCNEAYHQEMIFSEFPPPKINKDFPETRWEDPSSLLPKPFIVDTPIESFFEYFDPLKPAPSDDSQNLKEENLNHIEIPLEVPREEQSQEEELSKDFYRIKIGDRLSISIYGEPNTAYNVTVDSSGYIYYLYIESIFVLGKTIDELRLELTEKLKTLFKHALVTITATRVGGEYYTILGEVLKPGQKTLHGKDTVLSALGAASGFTRGIFRNQTVDFADLSRAFLTRKGEYMPVNFERLVKEGDLTQNIPLESGDYIYIPTEITEDIFILGEVINPTVLTYMTTVTLVEALTEAQWITNQASSRILVLRGSLACPTQYLIDINSILRRCEPDFILEPGDIVYVPRRRFETLRQIVKMGIANFVSVVASFAGTRAYLSLNPGAGVNVIAPVNAINTTGITTFSSPQVVVSP